MDKRKGPKSVIHKTLYESLPATAELVGAGFRSEFVICFGIDFLLRYVIKIFFDHSIELS